MAGVGEAATSGSHPQGTEYTLQGGRTLEEFEPSFLMLSQGLCAFFRPNGIVMSEIEMPGKLRGLR